MKSVVKSKSSGLVEGEQMCYPQCFGHTEDWAFVMCMQHREKDKVGDK